MKSIKVAIVFGVLLWVIVFAVSFAIFPLKQTNRPLFESIMPVAISILVVVFSTLYFQKVTAQYLREGLLLGVMWLSINMAIDLPLFLTNSPMHMTFDEYMSDIGITYFIIPVFTLGLGYVLHYKEEKKKKEQDNNKEE